MAENQTDDKDKKNNDENDPYKFFKFAGPEDNKNNNKDKKKKPKFSFIGVLLLLLCAFAVIDVFFLSKTDNLIDYSEFRQMVEDGKIVYVEIGENYITGYGPSSAINLGSGSEKGLQLFQPKTIKSAEQYKTASVLMQNFIDLLDEKAFNISL